jgi:hypothetical protein
MPFHLRLAGFAGVVALLALPRPAVAQDPPDSRREGFGAGVMLTIQAGAGVIVSLRISVPAGRKFGVDADVGWAFGTKKLPPPIPAARRTDKPIMLRWLAKGPAIAGHLRWLPRGRRDSGWSTAVLGGARFVRGTAFDADNASIGTYWTRGFDLGLGIDRVLESRVRMGFEFGNSVTMSKPPAGQQILELSGPSIFASLFGSWMRPLR